MVFAPGRRLSTTPSLTVTKTAEFRCRDWLEGGAIQLNERKLPELSRSMIERKVIHGLDGVGILDDKAIKLGRTLSNFLILWA